MEFLLHCKIGPFIRSNNATSKMMRDLFIALLPIILFATYKNGYLPYQNGDNDFLSIFYPLIFIFIAAFTSFISEVIWARFVLKKDGDELKRYLSGSFGIFPGLFLGLILPMNTPLSIVILGSIFASIIGKMLYGGFGNNIFNPALIGYLFVISAYAITIANHGGNLNATEMDAITTATPLSHVGKDVIGTYDTLVKPYGSLMDFFVGTMPGAMGETSALLCIVGFIYLVIKKVIKWIIPITYIGTVFIITLIIGSVNDLGIWYPLFQILSGGLMFGAIFMATDPVTSPTTGVGKFVYALFLGILTVAFRYLTPYPEGVMTSILTMNMFVFIIDKVGAKARFNIKKSFGVILAGILLILYLGISIGNSYQKETTGNDPNYKIISKDIVGSKTTYIVTQKGYVGNIKATIVIDNNIVTKYEVLEQNESFYQKVKDANYINTLIKEQNNLETLDTVSGATFTSTALKKMLINTLDDYKKGNNDPINNGGNEPAPQDFNVLDKVTNNDSIIYTVSNKSFGGIMKLNVTFKNNVITSIVVLEEHDSYFDTVTNAGYINTLIQNQNNLDNLDTVSGATISSGNLKEAIMKTIEAYGEDHEE